MDNGRRTRLILALALALVPFTMAAQTLIDLALQVKGILPVANGGTGVATTSAGTFFGRNIYQGAGEPSFISFSLLNGVVTIPSAGTRVAINVATGSGAVASGETFTAVGTASDIPGSTSTAPARQLATSTTNGNVASTSSNLNYLTGKHLIAESRFKLSATSKRRDWLVFTDQTAATMGGSDNPAGNYVGLWYCNDAASTNCQKAGVDFDATTFWCVSKDGTTQSLADSSVSTITSLHLMTIVEDTVTPAYDIFIDGSSVCHITTHLPTATTVTRYVESTTCTQCTPTAQNFQFQGLALVMDYY